MIDNPVFLLVLALACLALGAFGAEHKIYIHFKNM
jgi:hypothetical protein